jgi:hypothetical protein
VAEGRQTYRGKFLSEAAGAINVTPALWKRCFTAKTGRRKTRPGAALPNNSLLLNHYDLA